MIWGYVRPQTVASAPVTAPVSENRHAVAPGATRDEMGPQIAAETFRCAQPNCGHLIQDHTDRALFGPGCAPPIQHGTASYATGRCGCAGWVSEGDG